MARTKTTTTVREILEPAPKPKRKAAKKPRHHETLDRVLERVRAEPSPAPQREAVPAFVGLRTARVVTAAGRAAEILFRGESRPTVAAVAVEVEPEVLERAVRDRESVLVEVAPGTPPVVVGVIQTRVPRSISLKGTTVEIEAEEEILLKTGRGAMRIRADSDIEIVGSRIQALSRGLFRIVGRMLRLN